MITKKHLKIAKSLFKKSLNDKGLVSPTKIKSVLSKLAREKTVGKVAILKVYKRLIENALKQEEVIIESATGIENNPQAKEIIKKIDAKKINFKTNSDLIFGAKITHGDWVFDATLDSKLKQLIAKN